MSKWTYFECHIVDLVILNYLSILAWDMNISTHTVHTWCFLFLSQHFKRWPAVKLGAGLPRLHWEPSVKGAKSNLADCHRTIFNSSPCQAVVWMGTVRRRHSSICFAGWEREVCGRGWRGDSSGVGDPRLKVTNLCHGSTFTLQRMVSFGCQCLQMSGKNNRAQ